MVNNFFHLSRASNFFCAHLLFFVLDSSRQTKRGCNLYFLTVIFVPQIHLLQKPVLKFVMSHPTTCCLPLFYFFLKCRRSKRFNSVTANRGLNMLHYQHLDTVFYAIICFTLFRSPNMDKLAAHSKEAVQQQKKITWKWRHKKRGEESQRKRKRKINAKDKKI